MVIHPSIPASTETLGLNTPITQAERYGRLNAVAHCVFHSLFYVNDTFLEQARSGDLETPPKKWYERRKPVFFGVVFAKSGPEAAPAMPIFTLPVLGPNKVVGLFGRGFSHPAIFNVARNSRGEPEMLLYKYPNAENISYVYKFANPAIFGNSGYAHAISRRSTFILSAPDTEYPDPNPFVHMFTDAIEGSVWNALRLTHQAYGAPDVPFPPSPRSYLVDEETSDAYAERLGQITNAFHATMYEG